MSSKRNMNFSLKEGLKVLLGKHQITASKRLGQHFLVDKEVLAKIIETADLKPADIVLEIGPGLGILTEAMAKRVKKVVAVEKDAVLAGILNEELRIMNIKNVEVVQDDILKISHTRYKIQNTKYKVVANLPYYITSPVIRKFLEAENSPSEMILMVQKEVAQRICARPPDMSLLAVSVQFYAEPEVISCVLKESFWPKPKVDSAIIKITPLKDTNRKLTDTNLFFRVVKTGFAHPRKQLIHNFCTGFGTSRQQTEIWLSKNSIQPSQRAETLSVEDWLRLTNSLKT